MSGSSDERHLATWLQRVGLFSGLSAEERTECGRRGRKRYARAGERSVRQGARETDLYVVLDGHLCASTTSSQGDELRLTILGPGDFFGEVALLDGGPRSAHVIAIDLSTLLVFTREAFLGLLARYPTLSLHLLASLATRVRALSERAEDGAFLDVRVRLAKAILTLSRRFGAVLDEGHRTIGVRVSQRGLAEFIGARREVVNRILSTWADERIIERDREHLVVRNEPALEGLIRSSIRAVS
jgi:CRP/FNR family cyclic AMP-dependent transcriptional regulator